MRRYLPIYAVVLLVCAGCASGNRYGELKPVEMTPVQAVRQMVKAASRGDREAVAQFMQPVHPGPPSLRDEKLEKETKEAWEQTKERMTKRCMDTFAGRSRREFEFTELASDAEAMLVEHADVRVSSEAGLKFTFSLFRVAGPFGRWSCYELSE
jgi:limonene-1,2-epoxide hydrolase